MASPNQEYQYLYQILGMFSFKSFCIFTTGWLIISISGFAQVPRIVINPQGHTGKIHSLIFTPDASQLISISEDKTIRIWNARTGAMEKKFETQIGDGYEGMLYASALSPNGKLLAVGGYQVATKKKIMSSLLILKRVCKWRRRLVIPT